MNIVTFQDALHEEMGQPAGNSCCNFLKDDSELVRSCDRCSTQKVKTLCMRETNRSKIMGVFHPLSFNDVFAILRVF